MRFDLVVEDGIFVGTTSGRAVAEVFEELLVAMLGDERWKPGGLWLHDHRELDAGPLTVEEIRKIAEYCIQRRNALGAGRLAVLVRNDLQFGLARMWAVYVEGRWDVTADVFRSREEALAWLRS